MHICKSGKHVETNVEEAVNVPFSKTQAYSLFLCDPDISGSAVFDVSTVFKASNGSVSDRKKDNTCKRNVNNNSSIDVICRHSNVAHGHLT